jgi:hypothetical protein
MDADPERQLELLRPDPEHGGWQRVSRVKKVIETGLLGLPKMMTKMKKHTKSTVSTLVDKGRVFAMFTNFGPMTAPSTIRTAWPPQNIWIPAAWSALAPLIEIHMVSFQKGVKSPQSRAHTHPNAAYHHTIQHWPEGSSHTP